MPKTFLGVVRVVTEFEKPPGDAANPESFDYPIKIKYIRGSSVEELVSNSNNYSDQFIQNILDKMQELIDEGASAIITTCGFLAIIHPIIRLKFPGFPIGTSALLQVPIANNLVELGKRVGVITFDGDVLGEHHLKGVGADLATPIVGVRKGCSFDQLVRNAIPFDYEANKNDIIEAGEKLIRENKDIGGIVLECANMGPYRHDVQKHFSLPVWDIITLANFMFDVNQPTSFR